MRRGIIVAAALVTLGLLGGQKGSATAQDAEGKRMPRAYYFTVKPPGSMDYGISDDPGIIRGQVSLALEREVLALRTLAGANDPEQLLKIRDVVKDGYVLLRTATHGLETTINKAVGSAPMARFQRERVVEVRLDLVTCMADLERAAGTVGDDNSLNSAKEILSSSIRRLQALLQTMF